MLKCRKNYSANFSFIKILTKTIKCFLKYSSKCYNLLYYFSLVEVKLFYRQSGHKQLGSGQITTTKCLDNFKACGVLRVCGPKKLAVFLKVVGLINFLECFFELADLIIKLGAF